MPATLCLLIPIVAADAWSVEHAPEAITVRLGDRDLVRYQRAMAPPPPGIDRPVAGNGFLHPVRTPSGAVVTDDFPPDHPHQHGLFYAWTKTRFRGHRVDFWNTHKGLGRVEHDRFEPSDSGQDFATIDVRLNHVDRTTDPPVVAMTERRTYRVSVVQFGQPITQIDVDSTLVAATDDAITLQTHLYGGFASRGARGWTIDAGHRFVTADGDDRIALNHTPQRWVASTGPVDGEPRTIAMFGHPDNVRSPQPVRLHPEMPYFVFSPTVNEPYVIRPGEPLRLRYRYLAIDDQPDVDVLDRLWKDYAAE